MEIQSQENLQFQIKPEKEKLIRIGELLKRTFRLFKERISTLLAIVGIGILISFAIALLFSIVVLLLSIPLKLSFLQFLYIFFPIFIVIIFIQLLISASLISALGENKKFGEAIKNGWQKIPSLFIVSLLSILAVLAGILFFILPGIIFAIWFTFVDFAVVLDGKRGIQALSFSKNLVSGKWWGVFGRLLLLSLVSGLIGFILQLIPLIGEFLSTLFLPPFQTIYLFLIYSDLKRIKGL